MNTVPEITSAGAHWASTPLLAAAQLWSWHPLWAAGIWTVYGIGALVPQGQAWLKPLTESPLYAKLDPLNPACGTQGLRSVTVGTPAYNKTTSILVTPTSTTSSPETARQSIKDDLSTPITTANATRISSPPALVPANNPTSVSSSSSFTPTVTPQLSSSSPFLGNISGSIDSSNTSGFSMSTESTRPFAKSGLELFDYPILASTSERSTSTPNPLIDPYYNEHGYDQFRWGHIGNYEIYGLSLELWAALTVFWAVLVMTLGLSLWKVYVATRPGLMWSLGFLAGLDIPQRVRLWYNASVRRVPNVQFKDQTPPRFNNTRRTRQRINICKQLLHSVSVEGQLPNGVVHAAIAIRHWFANLIWGGQTPLTRILRAGAFYVICLIFISYSCWLLSLLVDNMLSAAFRAIVVLVKGSQTTGPTPGFTYSSTADAVPANSIPTSIIVRVFTFLLKIKRCTVSAFQNSLFPGSTYIPSPTLLSRTGAICSWIGSTNMNFRTIPLLLKKSSVAAFKHCYSAACENRLSPTGNYLRARQPSPTASLCESIEWLVMSCRSVLQTPEPVFAALNHRLSSLRRFVGCLPIVATFSGSRCPVWAWHLNHVATITLLTALFTLNVGAISKWPAPRPRSAVFLAKRAAVVACLMFVPQGMLVAFLWTTRSSIGLGLLIVMATHGLCWFFCGSLATKWITVLQRLRVAPVNSFQGEGHAL